MIERFFFYRFHRKRGNKSVKGNHPDAALVAPNSARAKMTAFNVAVVMTKIANNIPVCSGKKQRRAFDTQFAVRRMRSFIF
jgi:hypothetical protein